MTQKLNALALGLASAILAAICMLVLGIFGWLGIYEGAVEAMTSWHMFFSLSIGGVIAGMIEAAIWSFIGGYVFGWFYNAFAGEKGEKMMKE